MKGENRWLNNANFQRDVNDKFILGFVQIKGTKAFKNFGKIMHISC